MRNEKRSSINGNVIRASVGKIRDDGKGAFVVTYPEEEDRARHGIREGATITFSIGRWQGTGRPEKGQMVDLHNVQLFQKGLRAGSAYPIEI